VIVQLFFLEEGVKEGGRGGEGREAKKRRPGGRGGEGRGGTA